MSIRCLSGCFGVARIAPPKVVLAPALIYLIVASLAPSTLAQSAQAQSTQAQSTQAQDTKMHSVAKQTADSQAEAKSASKEPNPPEFEPLRMEFFKCIANAAERKLDGPAAEANARKGTLLAIKLTSNPKLFDAERRFKRGYILEDFANYATHFLLQDSAKADLPLFDTLLKAEEKAALPIEPSYSCSCFELGKYYLRREPKSKGEPYFDKGMTRVNMAQYEPTNSIVPEWFSNYLITYENYLEEKHSPKFRKVREMRIQQRARFYNNVGNKYLDGVFGPPAQTGVREYEVKKAIEVYTKAIDLIPSWKEPRKGRAKAYKLLGKNKEAEEDLKKAE